MNRWHWVAGLWLCAATWGATAAPAYELPQTEVHTLRAEALKRDYPLYVSLPASYGSGQKTYPVVFITDAPYAFPLVRSLSGFISRHDGDLSEFILVGLGYAVGDTPVQSRNRDYTPTQRSSKGDVQAGMVYGQAEAYRRFVARDVFPFIASHYRANMQQKVFVGHSYGGLFGVHVLLTEPTMFNSYVLGSPSLWLGRRYAFGAEQAFSATKRDMPAKVYLAVGGYETLRPGSKDKRFNTEGDMVKDVQAFERQLKSHHYPGLTVRTEVIAGEDHATVFPTIATHGLMWALPAH